jgi:hypothetical protein
MSKIHTPRRVGRGGLKGPRGSQGDGIPGAPKSASGIKPKYTWTTGEKRYCATPAEREALTERALELRLQGMTYEKIGKSIGYSYRSVYNFIQEGLARRRDVTNELAAQLRKLQLERLDRIYAAHAPTVDSAKSATIMLKVLEREAKLLGIDAPQAIVFPPVVPEQPYDLSRLNVEELRALRSLLAKCATATEESSRDETTADVPVVASVNSNS